MSKIGKYFLLFFLLTVVFFYPVFLKGYIPFPGDLLLAEYQPWRSVSYQGMVAGAVPNKGQYFDTLRQLYPWESVEQNAFNDKSFPLWNPYNFSGTPLLANFQSAVMFPLHFFYLVLPQIIAWTLLVMLQPLLSLVFVYFLAKRYGLSTVASIFSAVSYAFCLYMTVFLEYNIMGHFMYLVPLSLLSIEWMLERKIRGIITLPIAISFAGFAGHAQLFAGLIFYTLLYASVRVFIFYKNWKIRLVFISNVLFFVILAICVTGVQLIPGLELINRSARSEHQASYFINNLLITPVQLVLYFIPDLFGNPAAKNYLLPFSYPSKALYIGLPALYFFILGIFIAKKNNYYKTIAICTGVFASIVFLNPLSVILFRLHIPFLSSSSPSNFIFFVSLGLCLLAGFGIDYLGKNKKTEAVVLIFLFALFFTTFLVIKFTHTQVILNNFIYSFILLVGLALLLAVKKLYKNLKVIRILFVILACIDLFYFFHKFNPFVPPLFVYPKTNIGAWLQKNTGIDRVWGYGSAGIEPNFASQLSIYSPDGYDPLYGKTYGELIQASKNGRLSYEFNDQTRSDAVIAGGYGQTQMVDNTYRLKLLSALGVKYILDKVENGSTTKTFPPEIFTQVSKVDDFTVFLYKKAAPRFFLTHDFSLYNSGNEFTNKFFSPKFNPSRTLLLEEKPKINVSIDNGIKKSTLVLYSHEKVIIKTELENSALLYLSDSYYPGWKASIDKVQTHIYLTNYAFRSVVVPRGKHTVTFVYDPGSFKYGYYISILSSILVIAGIFYFSKKKVYEKMV